MLNMDEVKKNGFLVIGLTIFGYCVAYFLSSKEILTDWKNILFLFIVHILWVGFSKIFSKSKNAFWTLYCISFGLGIFIAVVSSWTEPFAIYRLFKDFLYNLSLPLIPFCLYCIEKNRIVKKTVTVAITFLASLYFLYIAIFLGYYEIFKANFSSNSLIAFLHTDIQEAKEFIATYVPDWMAILLLLSYVIVILILYYLYSIISSTKMICSVTSGFNRKHLSVLMIAIIVSCGMFGAKMNAVRVATDAWQVSKRITKFEANSKERIRQISSLQDTDVHTGNESFALVIGETHVRNHMHAYGYERNTTPYLDKAIKNGSVLLALNSFSGAAQTDTALRMSLTEKSQYNDVSIENAATLVEMAHHGGYKVVWISNQQKSDLIGIVAETADECIWLNKKTNDTYLRQKNGAYDEHILTALKKRKKPEQKTLYVIHLLGSHAQYDCRYPDSFKQWDESAGINKRTGNSVNSYDNSVLYNDYILNRLQHILLSDLGVSAMLYFSDHGEELQNYFCHGEDFFVSKYKESPYISDIVKIPFLLAVTPTFQLNHPAVIKAWKKNEQKYFTNDMIYDTVLGLLNIRCQHYNSRQDFTWEQFGFPLDKMRTGQGKVALKDCL